MTFTSSLGWSFAYKPIESALFEALSPCAESRREHFNTRNGKLHWEPISALEFEVWRIP